jgi:hypothetical protein
MEEAELSETLVFVCTTTRCHTKHNIILRVNSNFTVTRSLHDLRAKRAGKGMLRHNISMTRIFAVSCSMHGFHVEHFFKWEAVVVSKSHGSNTLGMWQLRACISMSPIATRDFATSSQSQLHIFLQLKDIIAVPLYPPYKITQLYKGKEQSLWLH